jgi:hypothetical protein
MSARWILNAHQVLRLNAAKGFVRGVQGSLFA